MSRKKPSLHNSKTHKENFQASFPCRLINPSKSELGKVSKVKLEKINQTLTKNLDVNQWKNSSSVLEWFKGINHKKDCIFVKFDIREFCSSISESIFKKSILFAKEHNHIPDEDVGIIDENHCYSMRMNLGKRKNRKLLRRDNRQLRRSRNL